MAKIYNSQLTKELTEGGKIQTAFDKVPSELAEKVVPVMEVNPKLLKPVDIVRDVVRTSTGTDTLYTTPTDQDFYLTNIVFSVTGDAANDGTYNRIQAYVGGVQRNMVSIRKTTLTAIQEVVTITFPKPVKIDKGTSITQQAAFSAGTGAMHGTIYGFLDEVSQA